MEKEKLPEPRFLQQANALIDAKYKEAESIEDPAYGPGLRPWDHKLLVKLMDLHMSHIKSEVDLLNKAFHQEMIGDVVEIIKDQWIRVLDEKLTEFNKLRDRKLIKWLLITAFVTFILSIIAGVIASVWYHNNYLVTPIPKPFAMLFSLLRL